MIKKITISGVWVGNESKIIPKSGPNKDQEITVCKIGVFTPDTDKEFAGKFISYTYFPDKTKTAKMRAEAFKKEVADNGTKEMIVDIIESKTLDRTGVPYISFKFLSKDARAVAEQLLGKTK